MNGRTGGKTDANRDHEQNVYFHQKNAGEIARYLLPHYLHIETPKILDACAGEGALGKAMIGVLEDYWPDATLVCMEKENGADIFDTAPSDKYDIIVSNPPWTLKKSLPIYEHLLTMLTPRGILLFVINNVFVYQGSDRAEKLKYQKYYFLPRWVFAPAGRPLLDCGVMVYHKDNAIPAAAAELRPFITLSRVDTRIE